jgi:hypothetical protein
LRFVLASDHDELLDQHRHLIRIFARLLGTGLADATPAAASSPVVDLSSWRRLG